MNTSDNRPATLHNRTAILAGNWKMNLRRAEVRAFAAKLKGALGPRAAADGASPQVALFPSHPFLGTLADALRGTAVIVGAQDVHSEASGAHTGDVSAHQVASTGATWALCGHSERRADHGEGDALVARKAGAALGAGLGVMVCLGETLEQREGGDTEEVLDRQLAAFLDGVGVEPLGDALGRWALAYEPVWAIGTGKTATPRIAQEAHVFLRARLAAQLGEAAASVPLLYGGSAKPGNCEELFAEPDVDGFLIGGASLDPATFLDMIHRCGDAPASD